MIRYYMRFFEFLNHFLQASHPAQKTLRDLFFALTAKQPFAPVPGNEGRRNGTRPEGVVTRAVVIGHDPIEIFSPQFRPGATDPITRFQAKSNHHPFALAPAKAGDDIWGLF